MTSLASSRDEFPLGAGTHLAQFPTPGFVVNLAHLEANLQILSRVQRESGAKIILALKGFSMYALAPLVMKYLKGTTASGLHELMLGYHEFKGECHVYSPAFDPRDFDQILKYGDHIVFNSPAQWLMFKNQVIQSPKPIIASIRVNPEYSEVEVDLYNPCAPGSRMGTTFANFDPRELEGITGLNFHTMCEQDSYTLERTLKHVEEKFGSFIRGQCSFVNFGGGHHITKDTYDVEHLVNLIKDFKSRFNGIDVYLEPGEAVALNAGVLIAQVLDTMNNGIDIAILDTSATTHMPDVIEMPYRPKIVNSGKAGEKKYTYRLTGLTCLSGDIIGDYSFDKPLAKGDKLVFLDMAHYSMVKTTTFNGVKLPSISTYDPRTNDYRLVKEFGYEDFKSRLS
jgi:carboxynorspermidine decarboxylase